MNSPCVLVTRPEHQADNLVRLIERRGWHAIRFPVLEIVPAVKPDAQPFSCVRDKRFDAVIFISANAVNFALRANSGKIDPFKNHRIAAIGRATAKALEVAGLRVDWLPEAGFSSEALLAIPQFQTVKGQSFLIVRGEGGREELADALRERGAIVEYLEVYKRTKPNGDNRAVVRLIENRKLNVVTVTSGEGLQNLLEMLGLEIRSRLLSIPLVVISDRMKELAIGMGFESIAVTDNPADAAILEKVKTLIDGEYSGRIE